MRQITSGAILATFMAGAAFSQPAASQPAFEVASVKHSQTATRGMGEFRREQIQTSPDGVTMRNLSLRSCIRWAFHVSDYQVQGPDWLISERFDIVAKASEKAPEDQLRLMMQGLLAERFKLASHRQSKEANAYVLLVGKNGPKFKESTSEGEMDIQPDQRKMTVVAQRVPMSMLVEQLSDFFRAPVIDKTELKGKYDVTIDVAKYIMDMRVGDKDSGGGAPPDPLSIIIRGLQEELGLKLESSKATLDLLVIDHIEKAPIEN